MAGLLSRQQTGKGVWIDCNLFESQVRTFSRPVTLELANITSLEDCGIGECCVELLNRRTGSFATWYCPSIYRSISGLPL